MIKQIIDKHGSSSASLKDSRIAAIFCIGFAGFSRYDELSRMSAAHLEFFPTILEFSSPRLRTTSTEKGIMYISRAYITYSVQSLS